MGYKGYWLTRNEGLIATRKSPYQFDKMTKSLKRRGTNCHNRQYFIPQYEFDDQFRAKNIPVEEDLNNNVVEQLASNVDFVQGEEDSLTTQLKKARLQKLQTDTKLLNQKLDLRKKQLFSQWSQSFFNVFADNFGKLRNCLINMHLNEEQLNVFNQTLDHCIQNLELHLTDVWNQFKAEQEQTNEKED